MIGPYWLLVINATTDNVLRSIFNSLLHEIPLTSGVRSAMLHNRKSKLIDHVIEGKVIECLRKQVITPVLASASSRDLRPE